MAESPIGLKVCELYKEFRTAAETLKILTGVQFQMQPGDILSIVGPSGCGKSTLLHILGALDSPTSGHIELEGVNPFALTAAGQAEYRNRSVGFVFQDHHLLPQLTVLENVLLPALAHGRASHAVAQRAHELMAAVGLSERSGHVPSEISGGERQRAAVARALLHRPPLILADEPTGNLDTRSSRSVADVLFDLPKQQGAMLIVVTHSPELAARAARRMRIESGRLIEC
ncbi:MAG: ABC transporter ATP-binding protein [Pirellulaceae bacterium]|nr:ABC transporter ATP-binding protein [Pirellulaceae bacterium]